VIHELGHTLLLTDEHAELYDWLDTEFKQAASALFDARTVILPSLMDATTIGLMGYESSFAGHLSSLRARGVPDDAASPYLVPAACLAVYPLRRALSGNEDSAFTGYAKVFRYEDGVRDGAIRTWEFNVREIVFLGRLEYVRVCLAKGESYISDFCRSHDLPVTFEWGTDAFTGDDASTATMRRFQLANQSKREVLWQPGDRPAVPLASLNYHGDHFSAMFDWSDHGEHGSGCIGFGLQRWVRAWKF
jgi:hypothetical protein